MNQGRERTILMTKAFDLFIKNVEEKKIEFPFSLFNSIPIHNNVYEFPFDERLFAFKKVFEKQIEDTNELISFNETILNQEQISDELKKSADNMRERYENQMKKIIQRINIVASLHVKLKENKKYDFDLNKTYEIKNWDNSVVSDTGMGGLQLDEKFVKVETNSVFENAYFQFILGVKDNVLSKDHSDTPYICVKPVSGECQGFGIYVAKDKILI
jgi:hypothetical protein